MTIYVKSIIYKNITKVFKISTDKNNVTNKKTRRQ